MLAGVRFLARSAQFQIKRTALFSIMPFIIACQPIIFSTVSYFLLRGSQVAGVSEYILCGSGLITLWMTILWATVLDIDQHRITGLLDAQILSPTPFLQVTAGRLAGNILLGLSVAISVMYCVFVLKLRLTVHGHAQLLIALVASAFSFATFAMVLSLLFVQSPVTTRIASNLSFPIYVVSGVYFPLGMLPGWARAIGMCMPLAWARESVRWAIVGPGGQLYTPGVNHALGGLVAIGLCYYILARLLYWHVIEYRARRLGQLGMGQ